MIITKNETILKETKQAGLSNSSYSVKDFTNAYRLWLLGDSLRDIEQKTNIPKSTLSYYFRRIFGTQYRNSRRVKGTYQVLLEYLDDVSLSTKDRKEIQRFLDKNREQILEFDFMNREQPLFTDREIINLTYSETSRSRYDFRVIVEKCIVKGEIL